MKPLHIFALLLLIAFPAAAQEQTCEIDLSDVETLLEEALAAEDTASALIIIADMRTALEAIEADCAPAVEINLDETFEAPDGSFTLSYPDAWVIDDSDSSGSEMFVFLGNSRDVLDAVMNASDAPVLESGQQLIAVAAGDVEIFATNLESGARLEELLKQIAETMKEQYPSVTDPTYFSVNDRRAGQIEFDGETFAALVLFIEIRAGEQYIALISVSTPDEMDALHPIVSAVAESIRIGR